MGLFGEEMQQIRDSDVMSSERQQAGFGQNGTWGLGILYSAHRIV